MFDVFGTIKSLIKIESVQIDNNVFRLHYRFTVVLLVAFSIIVNSRQYFGDPIDCTNDPITAPVIDNHCWMHSYLTLPNPKYPDEYSGQDFHLLPHFGIRRSLPPKTFDRYQRYYQWVGFALFVQAAFFFLPRLLWKYCWEGGRVKSLVAGLKAPFGDEKDYMPKINQVLNYIKNNRNQNKIYAYSFYFCEFLNLVNVICQIFIADWFLDYQFISLGSNWVSLTQAIPGEEHDILRIVFPKVAKCDFRYIGHNGDMTIARSICVLPVNTFNEKIYIVIWFWFMFLTTVSALHLMYTLALVFVPRIRTIQLQRNFRVINENPWDEPSAAQIEKKGAAEGPEMTDDEIIQIVTTRLPIGDWFLLYQLGKNMDALVFGKLLKEYATRLKNSSRRTAPSPLHTNQKRNSSFEGKRGSFMGVGIGSSAPLVQ